MATASKHAPTRAKPFPLGLIIRSLAAWAITLLLFFPLGWLLLTAFKTELQAIAQPPLLFFTPTIENFIEVQSRSDYLLYAGNSLVTSVASTLLGLANSIWRDSSQWPKMDSYFLRKTSRMFVDELYSISIVLSCPLNRRNSSCLWR